MTSADGKFREDSLDYDKSEVIISFEHDASACHSASGILKGAGSFSTPIGPLEKIVFQCPQLCERVRLVDFYRNQVVSAHHGCSRSVLEQTLLCIVLVAKTLSSGSDCRRS